MELPVHYSTNHARGVLTLKPILSEDIVAVQNVYNNNMVFQSSVAF